MKARIMAAITVAALAGTVFAVPAGAAAARTDVLRATQTAAVTHTSLPWRLRALRWAHTQRGKWYCWGGTGPGCYDCSGLVMEAYLHAGVHLPRTTREITQSSMVVQIPRWEARWGDIVSWGWPSFHVELDNGYSGAFTFGAHSSGEPVGYAWQSGWWYDAETFYRVVRAWQ